MVRSVGTKSSKHISFSAEGFQSVGNQSGAAGLTSVGGGGLFVPAPARSLIKEDVPKLVPVTNKRSVKSDVPQFKVLGGGGGLFVPAPDRSSIKEDVPKFVPYYTDEEDR